MINTTKELYNDGKKNLETLLREKAYSNVQNSLKDKGIDINSVSDEDIESLVATQVEDMQNGIKGFGIGTAFALIVSSLIGV